MGHDLIISRPREYGALPPRPSLPRLAGLALAMLVLAACEPAKPRDVPPSPADLARADSAAARALGQRYPERRLAADTVQAVPGTSFRAAKFRYQTPGREDGHGTVVGVWTADAGTLAWTHDRPGDFPPHGLVWLDADADGQADLFFTAGEEDVFETYVFANRTAQNQGTDSAFVQAYHSANDYTTLLDLDGDGSPELIDSGHPGDEHAEPEACTGTPPPAVQAEAQREYQRLAGPFDAANFNFGFANFATWTLHLLDPVRILHLRDGQVRYVSGAFPQHLRWRIRMLEQYREAETAECRAHIDRIIEHLRRAGA